MTTYISILRGINVSGKNLIKMDALRQLYEDLRFHHVRTYVQSGNVVFSSTFVEPKELEEKIAQRIEEDFGFHVPAIVLTTDEWRQIIDKNPFIKDPDKDRTFLHITFLSLKPQNSDVEAIEIKKQNGEEIVFSGHAVYLYCPNGYGKTKLTNTFLEKKLKVGATTRNWKTTNELLKIAEKIAL